MSIIKVSTFFHFIQSMPNPTDFLPLPTTHPVPGVGALGGDPEGQDWHLAHRLGTRGDLDAAVVGRHDWLVVVPRGTRFLIYSLRRRPRRKQQTHPRYLSLCITA